jgi:hypothetical protein
LRLKCEIKLKRSSSSSPAQAGTSAKRKLSGTVARIFQQAETDARFAP